MITMKDFTPEIQAKIPEYQARALEGVSDGGRYRAFSLEKAKECVDFNYKEAQFAPPKWVFAAENPFEAQIMFNYLKSVFEADPSLLEKETYDGPLLPPKEELGKYAEYNNYYIFTMNVYSDCYYTWYEFIRKEFNLPLSINDKFQEFFRLQRQSGIFNIICAEPFAVVAKYPLQIKWNNENLLHNLDGQAIDWSASTDYTGFDCYYVNGRNLPADIYNKIKDGTFTLKEFMSEGNEETKSTAIMYMQELHGDGFLVDFFGKDLKVVDTYVDKKSPELLEGTTKGINIGVYTLFKGRIMDDEVAYVRCYCPSTDRMFFLGVEERHTNAKDAIASLYRVPKKMKPYIKYIQRQGERFSTVFTSEGKEIVKKLSKEDLADMTSISGEEYFSKMRYEY